jgi:hypothetical protein
MPRKPTKVVVFENADKARFKTERWSSDRDLAAIPHPFRLLALGSVGRGKTTSLMNIFLAHQASSKPFKELYIVCPDSSSEWESAQPTQTLHSLPDPELFTPTKKTLLVIDDWEMSGLNTAQKKKLSTLFRYVSSHMNVSIMLSFQSFFDCAPMARKCANCFILWKPTSKMECTQMGNRCGLDKGVLDELFIQHSPGDYDNIMIDRTVGTKTPIRKNIYEVIKKLPDVKKPKKPVKKKKKRYESSSEESSSESD